MKRLILILIGIACIAGGGVMCVKRHRWISASYPVTASVTKVDASNGTCTRKKSGKSKGSRSYSCTRFTVHFQFTDKNGSPHSFTQSGGSATGHNQPVSSASYQAGKQYPALHNPTGEPDVLLDSFGQKWGAQSALIAVGLVFFVMSFVNLPGKYSRRRSW